MRIGELSLGEGFEGLLPWGHVDNRPYLRCMHGYELCPWRLGRYDEAGRVFEKMLSLNPSDNQGVRSLVEDVRAGKAWDERSTVTQARHEDELDDLDGHSTLGLA